MIRILLPLFALFISVHAVAVTECRGKVINTYLGDAGNGVGTYWMVFVPDAGGGAINANFLQTAPGANYMVAGAMAAKMQNQEIILRFKASSLNCASLGTRGDIIGLWTTP